MNKIRIIIFAMKKIMKNKNTLHDEEPIKVNNQLIYQERYRAI